MHITVVKEANPDDWENHIKKASGGPFLSRAWLESFQDSKCATVYFRFVSGNETVGLAAGLSIEPPHSFLTKIYRKLFLFSGPAFLQPNPELEKTCVSRLIDYASENNYTHLEMRSYDYPRSIDFDNLHFIKEDRDEFIIDLTLDWADIKKRMRRMVGKQTRKAIRFGLSFEEGQSPELVEDLAKLMEQTKQVRLSKGYTNYSHYYMPYINKQQLLKLAKNRAVRLFCARKGSEAVCIMTILDFDDKAYALFIGSCEEGYNLQAPAFLTFNMIKKLKTEGYQYLNLGGVPADSSRSNIIFNKTSFGAEQHLCSGGKTPHLNGSFFNILNIVYSKMPDNQMKKIFKKSFSGRT